MRNGCGYMHASKYRLQLYTRSTDKLWVLTDEAILLIGLSPPENYRPLDALTSIRERGRQVIEDMTGTSGVGAH